MPTVFAVQMARNPMAKPGEKNTKTKTKKKTIESERIFCAEMSREA